MVDVKQSRDHQNVLPKASKLAHVQTNEGQKKVEFDFDLDGPQSAYKKVMNRFCFRRVSTDYRKIWQRFDKCTRLDRDPIARFLYQGNIHEDGHVDAKETPNEIL